MRILFSATPAHGHVLPMMPLARAAMSAGHEVSLLTHGALSEWVEPVPVPVLAVGLTFDELRATFSDRAPAPRAMTTPEGAAEFFVDTRVTATLDPALSIAAAFRPDLLIAEAADAVGFLVAGQLGVPWAVHSLGMAIPGNFAAATADAVSRLREARGLHRSERIAYLDICPAALQALDWEPPSDRIAVRPSPFDRETGWVPPAFEEPANPVVLVTFGTVLDDVRLVRETLEALTSAKVNVLVTSMPNRPAPELPDAYGRVRDIGFVPLARVLPVVDAVACAGGMGTVLAVLANGLPFIGLPKFPSQRWITARAAELGGGVVLDGPDGLADALGSLLSADQYRRGAAAASTILAEMTEPAEALTTLLELAR